MSLSAASESTLASCILPYLLDVEELTSILESIDDIRSNLKPVCQGQQVVSARHWCSGRLECNGACYGDLMRHWPTVSKHCESCALAGQRNVTEPSTAVVCGAAANAREGALLGQASAVLRACVRRLRTPDAFDSEAVADVNGTVPRRNTHLRLALNIQAVAKAIQSVACSLFPRPISRAVCTAMLPVAVGGFTGTVKCGAPLACGSLREALGDVALRLSTLQVDLAGISVLVGIASHPCLAASPGVALASAAASAPSAPWGVHCWAGSELQVVQEISYDEPAAQRDEDVLRLQADEEWASLVERRIYFIHNSSETATTTCPDGNAAEEIRSDDIAESVHILRFGSGDGELFRQQLLNGPEFRPCRQAMESEGQSCVHPSQAIMLVKPDQYREISFALKGYELHPFHVVITESFEYLLEEVLAGIPCRRRPRQKANTRQEVAPVPVPPCCEPPPLRAQRGAGEQPGTEEPFVLCERRTFLCMAPRLRDFASVVQSTTEAIHSNGHCMMEPNSYFNYFRGINPRRIVVA